jgi:hypothetical protein
MGGFVCGVVKMTGMAFPWIGATIAFRSVVRKANRSLAVTRSREANP